MWSEELLESIRGDFARPTVHARNLYHTAVAMWDAWATYDATAQGVMFTEDHSGLGGNIQAMREESISYACYRLLRSRFIFSPSAATILPTYDMLMSQLGYDPAITTTVGNSPAAIGNRIALTILNYGFSDNSHEDLGYVNLYYSPVNSPLVMAREGNPLFQNPNRWQPLGLGIFIDQAGNPILGGAPPFLSPEWGQVKNFSLSQKDLSVHERGGFDYWTFHDPGEPALLGTPSEDEYRRGFEMVAIWSSHLDPTDGVMIDASPNAIGNATLPTDRTQWDSFYDVINGGDASQGYTVNPVTGNPYPPQIVPRGDYARCLAEFWADGPDSETPPGHWFTLLNTVSDSPLLVKQLGGTGPVLGDLEWDVKCYLALGGAMHDVAVASWGCKGRYDYLRPVSAIRYLSRFGQSTDPMQPSYDPRGIDLYPGLIEVVTPATTAVGQRHEHLAGQEGKIAILAWNGPDAINDPAVDTAGVGWILAGNWWPYQRPTFVTPPFAGYVSGHSTYSRAAAVVMEGLTGSPYFPGGLGEFICPQNQFLVFENGPSVDVRLQWVSYYDASDQCSLSRIWGGIHPRVDDIPGRYMGQQVGEDALDVVFTYFDGTTVARGSFETSGTACAGTNGEVSLSMPSDQQPVVGSTMAVEIDNLAMSANVAGLAIGFSEIVPAAALDMLGMPGCVLSVNSTAVESLLAAGGQAAWTTTIPDDISLYGTQLFVQAISLDPGANTLGVTTSALGEITLGR